MRERWTMVLGAGALVLAGTALSLQTLRAEPVGVTEGEVRRLALESADERARDLEHELARLERRVDTLRAVDRDLEQRIAALRDEAAIRRGAEGVASPDEPESVEESAEDAGAARRELLELRELVLDGQPSPEDLQRFLELARRDGLADTLIAESAAEVEANPRDAAARMRLADAFLTKLLTVPGGPEQGVWGMKAEREWQAVLEQDADHWEARHNLAFSWSMWPEFLGKTDAAVAQYERLVETQERGVPEARQAAVYVELARLYRRTSDDARARATLERGLLRHPGSAELADALRAEEE